MILYLMIDPVPSRYNHQFLTLWYEGLEYNKHGKKEQQWRLGGPFPMRGYKLSDFQEAYSQYGIDVECLWGDHMWDFLRPQI